MEQKFEEQLICRLKNSLGDLNNSPEMNLIYLEKINQAVSDLISDDISEEVLSSELGLNTITYYATLLLQEKDFATNSNLLYLRNRLSEITKGDRYSV